MTLLQARQFRRVAPPGMMWHGTPDERTWGTQAHYGIHVGTKGAAQDALHARIGTPAEGEWRGDRDYGKTLLASYEKSLTKSGYYSGPVKDEDDRLPTGEAKYSSGDPVPMDARPSIFPVRLKGPMTNTPSTPHEDFKANALMAGQIKRGRAKRGYFYKNISEDEGSISAVVPTKAHLERLDPKPQFGRTSRYRRQS